MATEATKCACHQFLDYCASLLDGSIRYYASDIILNLHSDSSYLNAIRARSRQGGHFYLGNKTDPNILNGTILNLAAIMKMVLSSAAEAEFGALFHNTKEVTPLRTTLEELGHPQPPTPTLVDNSTAVGLVNDTVTQHWSHAIHMHFYWVCDHVNQKQFLCFGLLLILTSQITSQSTTHHPTTEPCTSTLSTQQLAQSTFHQCQHATLRGCVHP